MLRHDNAPHEKWKGATTFPKHCHEGSEENIVLSLIPDNPDEALRYFLQKVKEKIVEFNPEYEV